MQHQKTYEPGAICSEEGDALVIAALVLSHGPTLDWQHRLRPGSALQAKTAPFGGEKRAVARISAYAHTKRKYPHRPFPLERHCANSSVTGYQQENLTMPCHQDSPSRQRPSVV
jgi:hypothetical protein